MFQEISVSSMFPGPTAAQCPEERAGARRAWLRRWWPGPQERLEDIRSLMLGQLGAVADAAEREDLRARILGASGSEALWALRHDWMQALAATQGLLLARQRMSDVSFMFAGMLDRAHHARTGLEMLQADAPRGLVRHAQHMRTDH